MWNRISQVTGISSESDEQANVSGRDVSRELQEQLEQQNVLIAQLKHFMRENEEQLKTKEKELEENQHKFQKFKLQSKAKIAQLSSQLKEQKGKDHEESVDEGSGVPESENTRGKMLLFKKMLEENRAKFEKEKKEMQDNKEMLESVVEQLNTRLEEKVKVPKQEGNSEQSKDVQEMYAQIVYKDSKILELNNQILEHERRILDLQENLREKDEVLSARNKAIQLMSEDLSRKGKSVVDELDDTRTEMKQMQQNFAQVESQWKEEKTQLETLLVSVREKHETDILEKERAIGDFEETVRKLEATRFELSARNAELQEKLVVQRENLVKWKTEHSKTSDEELSALKNELEEKSSKLAELEKTLKETSNSTDTKVLKARVKERSRAKGLERQLQEMQKKEAEHLTALETKVAELEEEKGSLLLKLMELEDQNKLSDSLEENENGLMELKTKLSVEEGERTKLEEKLNNVLVMKDDLERNLQEKTIQEEEKGKLIEELQISLKATHDDRIALEMKVIELEELKEAEENVVQELKSEIQQLQNKMDQVSTPVLAIEKEKEALEAKLLAEVQSRTVMLSQHESAMSEITENAAALQSEIQELEKQLQQKESEVKLQEETLSELKEILSKTHTDMEEVNNRYEDVLQSEKKLKNLLEQTFSHCSVDNIEDLLETWDIQKNMTKDLEEELQRKCGELSQMLQIHSDLQIKAENAKEAEDSVKALQEELENATKEIERIQSVDYELKEEMNALKVKLSDSLSLIEQLKGENIQKEERSENLSNEIEKHQIELKEKNEVNKELQIKLRTVEKELEVSKDAQSLEGKKTETKMLSLLQQIQELEVALSETQESLASKEKILEDNYLGMTELRTENDSLQDKTKRLEADCEELQKEFELVLKEKECSFLDHINQLNNDLILAKKEHTELSSANSQLENELQLKTKEFVDQENKMTFLANEKQTLETQFVSVTEELEKVKETAEILQSKNHDYIEELSELQKEIARIRAELENTVSVNNSLVDKINDLESMNNSLSERLSNIQSELISTREKHLLESSEKDSIIKLYESKAVEVQIEKETLLKALEEKIAFMTDELKNKDDVLKVFTIKHQENEVTQEDILKQLQAEMEEKLSLGKTITMLEEQLHFGNKFFEFLGTQYDHLQNAVQDVFSTENSFDKKLKESCNELCKIASVFDKEFPFMSENQQQDNISRTEDEMPPEAMKNFSNLGPDQQTFLTKLHHLTNNVSNLEAMLQCRTSQLENLNEVITEIDKKATCLKGDLEVNKTKWDEEKQVLIAENERMTNVVQQMTGNSHDLTTKVKESDQLTRQLQEELENISCEFHKNKEEMESEISNARERATQLETTNKTLKEEFDLSTQNMSKTCEEKKVLEDSLAALQKEYEQLNSVNVNAKNEIEALHRNMTKLEKDKETLESSLLSCHQEMTTDASELHDARLKCNQLEHELEGLEKRCQDSDAMVKKQREDLERLQFFEDEYHNTVSQINRLEDELNIERSKIDMHVREEKELHSMEEQLRTEIMDLQLQISNLSHDLSIANENIDTLTSQLDAKNKDYEELENNCHKYTNDISNLLTNNENLNEQLSMARNELEDAINQKAVLESQIVDDKESHCHLAKDLNDSLNNSALLTTQLQSDLSEKHGELENTRLEMSELKSFVSQKDEEISMLSLNVNNMHNEIERLRDLVKGLSSDLQAKEDLVSSFRDTDNSKSETIAENEEQMQKLTTELESLKSELADVQNQFQNLQYNYQNINEELHKKERLVEEKESVLLQHESINTESSVLMQQHRTHIEELQLELDNKTREHLKISSELENIQTILRSREESLVIVNKNLETSSENEKVLQETVNNQCEQLYSTTKEKDDLLESLKNMEEKHTEVNHELQEKDAEISRLATEMERVCNSSDDFRTLSETLQRNYDQAQHRLTELEESLTQERARESATPLYDIRREENIVQRNESHMEDISNTKEENEALRSQLEANKSKMGKMLLKLKAFKERNGKLSAEIEKFNSFTPEKDREQLEELKSTLKTKEAQHSAEIKQLNTMINELKDKNVRLINTVEKNEVKIKELSQSSEKLLLEKDAILKECEISSSIVMDVKNTLAQVQVQKDALDQEISMLREQAEMLVSDNETFQNVVEELKTSKKNTEAELAKLKKNGGQENREREDRIKELTNMVDSYKIDMVVKTTVCEELQFQLDESRNMQETLKNISEDYSREKENIMSQVMAKDDEILALRKNIEEMNMQNGQLNEFNSQSKNTVKKLQEQIENLHEHRKAEHLILVQKANDNEAKICEKTSIFKAKTSEFEEAISHLMLEKGDLEIRNATLSSNFEKLAQTHREVEQKLSEYYQKLLETEEDLVEVKNKCIVEEKAKLNLQSLLNEKEKDIEKWTKELSMASEKNSQLKVLYKQVLAEKQTLDKSLLSEDQAQVKVELKQAMHTIHQQGLRCEQLNMEISKLLEEKAILGQQLMQFQRHERYSPSEQHNLSAVSTPSDHFKDISLQLEDEPLSEKQDFFNVKDQLDDLQRRLAESEQVREELLKSNEVLDEVIQRERSRRSLVEEELSYAQQQIGADTRSPSKNEYRLLLEEEPEMIKQTDYSISKARKFHSNAQRLHRWILGRKNYCSHILRKRSRLHLVFCIYLFAIHTWLLALVV